MQILISALLLAVFLPGAPPAPEPSCRAHLAGRLLTTTIKFDNGYGLEAPWQVRQTQRTELPGEGTVLTVDLWLDRIVEFDDLTGERSTTALPHPVRVQVEGATQPEVVTQAADTWCSSVIRAHGRDAASSEPTLPLAARIT